MKNKINKCPYCGSTNIAPLKTPGENQSFGLVVIEEDRNDNSTLYAKVSIIGCKDCQGLIITSPYLV